MGTFGTAAHRYAGMLLLPSVQTAALYVGRPLDPRIVSLSQRRAFPGDEITVKGKYINGFCEHNTRDFCTEARFLWDDGNRVTPVDGLTPLRTITEADADQQFSFRIPAVARGIGILRLQGGGREVRSEPIQVVEPPALDRFAEEFIRQGEVGVLLGRGFFSPAAVRVGDRPATAVSVVNPGMIRFTVPPDAPLGEHRVFVQFGDREEIPAADRLTVEETSSPLLPRPRRSASITVNARQGQSGPRYLTLEQALALAEGTLPLSALARRPLNAEGDPLDNTCPPYQAELVRGTPGPDSNNFIHFDGTTHFCTAENPPPPEASAPLAVSGNVSLPVFTRMESPLIVQDGTVLLAQQHTGFEDLEIRGGRLVISGKAVNNRRVKVVDSPPGGMGIQPAVRFTQDMYLASMGRLEIENPGGPGILAEDSRSIILDTVRVIRPANQGVIFGAGARDNTIRHLTVIAPGSAGLAFREGARGNTVGIERITGAQGPGIVFDHAVDNEVQGDANDQDIVVGGFIDANRDRGVLFTGAGTRGNRAYDLKIGIAPAGGSPSTGNMVGMEFSGGANGNSARGIAIAYSAKEGLLFDGSETAFNVFHNNPQHDRRQAVRDNAGGGVLLRNGAHHNRVAYADVSDGPIGVRLTDSRSNELEGLAVYNSGTGICIDGGSMLNVVADSEIFGIQGNGVEIRDAGTRFNAVSGGTTIGMVGAAPRLAPPDVAVAANGGHGVMIDRGASDNSVGWQAVFGDRRSGGAGVSGNGGDGVHIAGAGAMRNRVSASQIGAAPGTGGLPNARDGIRIEGGAKENVIGDLGVVSVMGNGARGICIVGEGTENNRIRNATVGFGFFGPVVPSDSEGILIGPGARNTVLGKPLSRGRPDMLVGVGGSSGAGIRIEAPNVSLFNTFAGASAFGNQDLSNGTGILLMPSARGARIVDSLVSGNREMGIHVAGTSEVTLERSWVGLDFGGAALPNRVGLKVDGGAKDVLVGTPTFHLAKPYEPLNHGSRFGGNTQAGVMIEGADTTRVVVHHNFFGENHEGAAVPNGLRVHILNSPGNLIGLDRSWLDLPVTPEAIPMSNKIVGSREAGIRIEGDTAAGNVIGGNALGRSDAPNRVGVHVIDAPETRIGGDPFDGGWEYHNRIFYSMESAIRIDGSGPLGTSVLYNRIGASGGAPIFRADESAAAVPPLMEWLSPTVARVRFDAAKWPSGGLLQVYTVADTPGLPWPADTLHPAADAFLAAPGDLLEMPAPAQPGTMRFATLTDPHTGVTSSFSVGAVPPPAPPPATVQITPVSGLGDREVRPGDLGVVAHAFDLTAQGDATLTGLAFATNGDGDEARALDRIRIGVAEGNTLTLDPNRPLLADLRGFARDPGVIALTDRDLRLNDGETARILALYDFSRQAPSGTYALALPAEGALSLRTSATLGPVSATGSLPLSGPTLTVAGGGADPNPPALGDVNGDAIVNVIDAVMALRYIVRLATFTDAQRRAADVNWDETVNVVDVVRILRVSVRIDPPFE